MRTFKYIGPCDTSVGKLVVPRQSVRAGTENWIQKSKSGVRHLGRAAMCYCCLAQVGRASAEQELDCETRPGIPLAETLQLAHSKLVCQLV